MRDTGNRAPDERAAPAPETGVEELARAADQLFYAMRRSRAATAGQAGGGLSLAQLALLDPLAEEAAGETSGREGLPVGRLAASAEVSVPTATRMLKQLEAGGVVTRRRSPEDERRVLVRLTAHGARLLSRMRAELRERQTLALSRFTPEDRLELAAQLRRLAEAITDPGH